MHKRSCSSFFTNTIFIVETNMATTRNTIPNFTGDPEEQQDNPKLSSTDIYTRVLGNNPSGLVRKEMEFAEWCDESPEGSKE